MKKTFLAAAIILSLAACNNDGSGTEGSDTSTMQSSPSDLDTSSMDNGVGGGTDTAANMGADTGTGTSDGR